MTRKVTSLSKGTDLLTRDTLGVDGLPSDALAWFSNVRSLAPRAAGRALKLHASLDVSELGMPEH